MSGFELVAGVIAIFFAAGVVVGALLVAALPGFRRSDRRSGDRRHIDDGRWRELPPLREYGKPPWRQDS
jgi:HAMP domain-containing protein